MQILHLLVILLQLLHWVLNPEGDELLCLAKVYSQKRYWTLLDGNSKSGKEIARDLGIVHIQVMICRQSNRNKDCVKVLIWIEFRITCWSPR